MDDIKRLDILIGKDPGSETWSGGTGRGLHEAERLLRLKGGQETIGKAFRGPRPVNQPVRKKKATEEETPGTTELCRFLALLDKINTQCPWAPFSFEANNAILRELVSNHLALIVGTEREKKNGGRLRSLIGSGLSPSNICWISKDPEGEGESGSSGSSGSSTHQAISSKPPTGENYNTQ